MGILRLVLLPSQAPPKRGQGRLEAKSHHFDEELQRKNTPPERFYFLDFQGGVKRAPKHYRLGSQKSPKCYVYSEIGYVGGIKITQMLRI